MSEDEELVIPGDRLGTVEEIIPGWGTYEEEGVVYSKGLGSLNVDMDELKASVRSIKKPAVIKKRDIIIARIKDIRSSMVVAVAVHIVGNDRQIAGETIASLHVSKVSKEYVEDLRRVYRIGDFIRAIVIQDRPSIQIATDGRDFGVLRALCMRCRTSMRRDGRSLKCPECGRIESRKIANDFGDLDLKKV